MKMGFDGANGIIDVAGTSSSGDPKLLINYYCGKDVIVGGGGPNDPNLPSTGTFKSRHSAYLATIDGSVGIGTTTPGATLDVAGDLKIGTLLEYSSATNVIVEDGTGKIGKKTISSLGDNLGNHTATQNIILGDNWLTASTTDNNGLHLTPTSNLTMIIGGNNSFEIKGGNDIPWRRGIGIPNEATSGQFNFYINPWQTDAAFNFNSHTPSYETTPGDPSTEVPAVTTGLFTILKNGNVGIGTTEPKEIFQIGDRFVFHNGGTKILGYNWDYDGGQAKYLVDGYSSQIRFSDVGTISCVVSPNGTAGQQIASTIYALNINN